MGVRDHQLHAAQSRARQSPSSPLQNLIERFLDQRLEQIAVLRYQRFYRGRTVLSFLSVMVWPSAKGSVDLTISHAMRGGPAQLDSLSSFLSDSSAVRQPPPAVAGSSMPRRAFVGRARRAVFGHCRSRGRRRASLSPADGRVRVQVDVLVLDRLPQPLDKHVVAPAALAVHTDRDPVTLEVELFVTPMK